MHILINGWFSSRSTAGSGQYVDRLLPALCRLAPDAQFTLLLPGIGDRGRRLQDQSPITQSPSHPVTQSPNPQSLPNLRLIASSPHRLLPHNLAKLWWEQVTVPRAARHLDADVLFVPYWAAPLWQPVPTVVTVHDLIPLLLSEYRGGLLNRLYTALVGHTARRAGAVITVSQASKRDVVEQLGIPAERVFVVYHGPNSRGDEWMRRRGDEHDQPNVRQKYQLPDRYFLYLGGFDVRKNVAGILGAYGRYRERGGDAAVKLVIAGELPDTGTKFAPDPRRMAADLGLLEHVHFTGWVDEEDKAALYAGAVAFLFPSRYEGFGMMVLEAMAAGCPVITSADCGTRTAK